MKDFLWTRPIWSQSGILVIIFYDNEWYDRAMSRWRWCNSTMTLKWCSISPLVSHHRPIALSTFLHMCCFWGKLHQMWIFIKHININKGIFDHSFIPETLIFLAYCCKIIKKISNCFYFFCLDINPKKLEFRMR